MWELEHTPWQGKLSFYYTPSKRKNQHILISVESNNPILEATLWFSMTRSDFIRKISLSLSLAESTIAFFLVSLPCYFKNKSKYLYSIHLNDQWKYVCTWSSMQRWSPELAFPTKKSSERRKWIHYAESNHSTSKTSSWTKNPCLHHMENVFPQY